MKKINGYGHGDHYVNFKIKTPKYLNEKQRALAIAYAELEEDTPGQIMGLTQKKDGEFKFSDRFFKILSRTSSDSFTDTITKILHCFDCFFKGFC